MSNKYWSCNPILEVNAQLLDMRTLSIEFHDPSDLILILTRANPTLNMESAVYFLQIVRCSTNTHKSQLKFRAD